MLPNQLPIVVATTGLSQATQEKMVAAAQKIPVFYSANMSVGINVLIKALKAITPPLEADFDIEIIEKTSQSKNRCAKRNCIVTGRQHQ